MSDRRPRLPRVTTLRDALAAGLSHDQVARRVASEEWSRLAPAVYCTQPPPTPDDVIRAAAAHGAPHGLLTGSAALTVLRVVHPAPATRPTVLVPYREGIRTTPLIQVRRATHLPPRVHAGGVSTVPLARAVIDHAMTLRGRGDVRALLARAVQRHGVAPADLDSALRQVATRGSRLVRASLAEISAGARSAPEAETAAVLSAAGLVGFEQNASLQPWGLSLFADFLWRELRAVLEVDSVEFHFDDADYTATLDRGSLIRSRGLDVLPVAPRMVRRTPETFARRVRDWLLGRAALLGVAAPFPS